MKTIIKCPVCGSKELADDISSRLSIPMMSNNGPVFSDERMCIGSYCTKCGTRNIFQRRRVMQRRESWTTRFLKSLKCVTS
jgi:predicted nucleic-acid-binding Zn-ribbon protein